MVTKMKNSTVIGFVFLIFILSGCDQINNALKPKPVEYINQVPIMNITSLVNNTNETVTSPDTYNNTGMLYNIVSNNLIVITPHSGLVIEIL